MPGRDEQFASQFPSLAHDLGAAARDAQDYQQMMEAAIRDAMDRPTEVREVQVSGTGVVELSPGVRAIVVALPTGVQLRIHLSKQNAIDLSRALGAPFKTSLEAPPEEPK